MKSTRYAAWIVVGWYCGTAGERSSLPGTHLLLVAIVFVLWLAVEVRREMAGRRAAANDLPRRDSRWLNLGR